MSEIKQVRDELRRIVSLDLAHIGDAGKTVPMTVHSLIRYLGAAEAAVSSMGAMERENGALLERLRVAEEALPLHEKLLRWLGLIEDTPPKRMPLEHHGEVAFEGLVYVRPMGRGIVLGGAMGDVALEDALPEGNLWVSIRVSESPPPSPEPQEQRA